MWALTAIDILVPCCSLPIFITFKGLLLLLIDCELL